MMVWLSKILGFFLSLLRSYFILIGVFFTIILLVFLSSGRIVKETSSLNLDAKQKHFLHLNLNGPLMVGVEPELALEDLLQRFLEGEQTKHYTMLLAKTLAAAAEDERIQGVFLSFDNFSASFTDCYEFRKALLEFKKSGKLIHTWLHTINNNSYYLASLGDKLYFSPGGSAFLPGPYFNMIYLSEALEKLGVKFEVLKSGKFKGAFETLTHDGPTQASRTVYQNLESGLRKIWVEDLAENLGRSKKEVRSLLKQSVWDPESLLEFSWVDELNYLDQALAISYPDGEWKKVDFYDYYRHKTAGENDLHGLGLAYIEAKGEIVIDGKSSGIRSTVSPEIMQKKLRWAKENADVKGVLLRIDSPGGSLTASDLIWHEVKSLVGEKPLVVSMGGSSASGGYYIASPANKIFANPGTLTGSIGVIGMLPKFGGFKQKYGINFHIFTQSNRAGVLNPGDDLSDIDRDLLEHEMLYGYNLFLRRVAQGRSMAVSDVEKIAQGRVWLGKQVLGKLVDKIGGLSDALSELKVLAGFNPESSYPLYRWHPDRISLKDCLHDLRKCMPSRSSLMNTVAEHEYLKFLNKIMAGKTGVQAIMPVLPQQVGG